LDAPFAAQVRAKELAEQKAKKKSIPKQDDEKFDALGNKIESVTAAADIDRDMVKKLTKQLKALKDRVKKGDASCEDEMFASRAESGYLDARRGCQLYFGDARRGIVVQVRGRGPAGRGQGDPGQGEGRGQGGKRSGQEAQRETQEGEEVEEVIARPAPRPA